MAKNTRLKAVLSLGIAIALLIIVSDLITAEDLNSKTLGGIIGSGIIWGALGGFILGWVMGVEIHINKRHTAKPDQGNEHVQ
ncbi:hypothetical protein [Flavihumibacter sp.]|uniref:hypothetical protein n=1 Tax=Flavihumibacter sp. TaxID=1913981 RepID=UPI002FC915F5